MTSLTSVQPKLNWWENDLDLETEGIQETQEVRAHRLASKSHNHPDTFADHLSQLLFTYLRVFVESGRFDGVLVSIFDDFLILVKGCRITEIPFKEIEAVQFNARGCPCSHKKKPSAKKKKQKAVKRKPAPTGITFSPELLRNLFSQD